LAILPRRQQLDLASWLGAGGTDGNAAGVRQAPRTLARWNPDWVRDLPRQRCMTGAKFFLKHMWKGSRSLPIGRYRSVLLKPSVPTSGMAPLCLVGWPSNSFLQLLGRTEGNLLAGCNLDRLACGRVASCTRLTPAHLERAKAADPDPVALFQVPVTLSTIPESKSSASSLRQLMPFGKAARKRSLA